jgi:DnaK suppressor protein
MGRLAGIQPLQIAIPGSGLRSRQLTWVRPANIIPVSRTQFSFRRGPGSSAQVIGRDEPMDKKKLEAFKKRLEERQRELRQTLTRTAQDGREADVESAQDIADRAANSYNKEFLFHQSNNERQLLQMVDGALDRIREGTFGESISCGAEINSKRLEAVPWTRYCIECQEKLEKGMLEHSST